MNRKVLIFEHFTDLIEKSRQTNRYLEEFNSKWKHRGVDSQVIHGFGNHIIVAVLKVKDELKGQGLGTQLLSELCDYADKQNLTIGINPSNIYGSKIGRLTDFYQRFGFIKNYGKGKRNFEYSDLLLRYPKK